MSFSQASLSPYLSNLNVKIKKNNHKSVFDTVEKGINNLTIPILSSLFQFVRYTGSTGCYLKYLIKSTW